MRIIRNNRALATAIACGSIPLLIVGLGKILGLISMLVSSKAPFLSVASLVIYIAPSVVFLMALILPNLDMLSKRHRPITASLFYKPAISSIAYYTFAAIGLIISFYLIFIIPRFLYFFAFFVLAILYFYFLAMAKLVIRFLGRENSPYGNAISYWQMAGCGLLAVVGTIAIQILMPVSIRRFVSGELFTCLSGMVGVGYMLGRVLQSQYDEEQFYLENYPEQVLMEQ
ncbi:hypothetical protein D1627_04310 [Pontibacter oryzae]|uniref:Uncharacterized protein n=2 Tax=Pontibacter oryzae TaxID=2304593 RepID=A0A399SKS2_9BACT|nr:hypothetical protein D1627_04310 [Pontibacter oryzae]